jgi:threonine dehydrogenase-like Zn-dependent dehydrogenase
MPRHPDPATVADALVQKDYVDTLPEDGEAEVLELTDGLGADAVLECVGTGQAMDTAFTIARPGAMVGFVGAPHGVTLPVRQMFEKNVGLAGGLAPVRRYLPELLALVLDGRIDPGRVFDQTLPLASVADGYRAMDERTAIKVFLQP